MHKNKYENAIFFLVFGGLGCFLLSFFAMGIAPWTTLKNVTASVKNKENPYYISDGQLSSIGRGRKIYLLEGCWHCHSQFVRPVAGEPFRYGPASTAWDSMYDVPHSFGTRRIGPDLSREAGRHSDDWHLAHLYNPRITVPLSVMPAYSWYFEKNGDTLAPKQEALDLVAYLQYLGNDYKEEIQSIVYPRIFKVAGFPVESEIQLERGHELFQEHCSGCHGSNGDARTLATQFMKPPPANLAGRYISPSEIYATLNRGVLGSAMPSFREMPEKDLWALAAFVSKMGAPIKSRAMALSQSQDAKLTAQGQTIFQTNCVACHGVRGAGDGAAAAALHPRPKDFTRRLFGRENFIGIMTNGVPGSVMPPFKNLSSEQVEALWSYVSQRYEEGL